jgi:predicted DNA-binding helix-hairpin-helix protein
MDRQNKLQILGQGNDHEMDGTPTPGRRVTPSRYGIFEAKSPNGKVPVMRTLMTSSCASRCRYCTFGLDVDFRRATWRREELAKTVDELWRADLAKGLFLTSGLAGNAVRMMDRMLDTVRILRRDYAYAGYVHLKILPGAEDAQVEESVRLADRVSLNLEAPTEEALLRIAPDKSLREDLALRLAAVKRLAERGVRPRSGLVTQFVVGPGGETDRKLLTAAQKLYAGYGLKRAYYSAFTPVLGTPMENVAPESPTREARLYQADWLLRFYGFDIRELPIDDAGALPRDRDPKTAWALANPHLWPVEINTVDRELLLRVPGIGPESAKRILHVRRLTTLRSPMDLERLHIRPKRVQNFVLFDGRHYPGPESWMMPAPTQLELFDRVRGFGRTRV